VIGEHLYGIAQARHRSRHHGWLDGFIADCAVLDVTETTTRFYVESNSN